jgi:iron(III) transport system ATP-binding protein
MSAVGLTSVRKSYGRTLVLDGISFTVEDARITAILGPSGSGKTTLLRLIAGFDRADAGRITVGDRTVDDGAIHVRPERRGIGYVPQDGALFPHLNAARNIGFGLGRDRHHHHRVRVAELLELVGLTGLGERYPHELSGGQQQRVALARALAIRPRLVLLDEPFSSLDASLRLTLRRDVARVLAATNTPAIIVTHDQDEALSLADRIAILDQGRILADATPAELYNNPANAAAAGYLGEANLLPAVISAAAARCALGEVALRNATSLPDGPATVLIRPEQLQLTSGSNGHGVKAIVLALDYHGHDSVAQLELSDATSLTARLAGHQSLRAGDLVRVAMTQDAIGWPD